MADVRPMSLHSEPAGSRAALKIVSFYVGLDAHGYPVASTDANEIRTTGALTDAGGRPEVTTTESGELVGRLAGTRLFTY